MAYLGWLFVGLLVGAGGTFWLNSRDGGRRFGGKGSGAESALASRPGRVDQAIEFPLPDEAGRRKLVALYAPKSTLDDELVLEIVRRTDGVSAAFIKELMRRTTQFAIERNGQGGVTHQDVDNALDEMLFKGGSLNLKLLGATERDSVVI